LVDLIVRPATRDDFPEIRSLIHAVRINPTGLDWRRFLVALASNGKLLGCGQIKLHHDGSQELASIAVKEEARGLGVARAVIVTLLGRELKRPLFLMCRAHLSPLYAKFGFKTVGIEEMPPYFKRISRAERLFNSTANSDDRLRVMRLD
jgi:N-acetylglutamate synthase-like GNAT family acetyltransferase